MTTILIILILLALIYFYWKQNQTKSLPKSNNDNWETWWEAPEWDSEEENKDWKTIHLSFQGNYGENLKASWSKEGFNYNTVKEWIDIGLSPTDFAFCSWLKKIKKLTPEQVLNHQSNIQQLRKDYQLWLTHKKS